MESTGMEQVRFGSTGWIGFLDVFSDGWDGSLIGNFG